MNPLKPVKNLGTFPLGIWIENVERDFNDCFRNATAPQAASLATHIAHRALVLLDVFLHVLRMSAVGLEFGTTGALLSEIGKMCCWLKLE